MNKSDIALELARKEFEKWAKGPKLPLERDRTLYAEYMTQLAWDAWKAALLRPHVWDWIPVGETDRLPKHGTDVLISYGAGPWVTSATFEWGFDSKPTFGFGAGQGFAWDVTHWAALPSVPLSSRRSTANEQPTPVDAGRSQKCGRGRPRQGELNGNHK